MIVVTFALPDESRDFVARLSRRSEPISWRLPMALGELDGRSVLVVHTGVGDSAFTRQTLDVALGLHRVEDPLRVLVAAGFAGALRPGLAVGELVSGENVSAPALLAVAREVLAGERWHVGGLGTAAATVETAAAKAALHAETGALAVDMETAWIAEACARAGVPMLSLRVISDAADQDFPVPGAVMFDPIRQRPRYLALPAYLLTHPACIPPFVRFVRGLTPARARLAEALEKVIGRLEVKG